MFFFSKHYIQTARRHICLTQACILSSTSNFFATIAAPYNNMLPQVKNITNVYEFRLGHSP